MPNEIATTRHKQSAELRVRDLLLKALTVSSGAIDAISFLALGNVFAAFMTGNIAFLGLRVAGAGGPNSVAIVVSMAAFAVGVYVSTCIVKPSEVSGLWPRRVAVALGLSLIAHAGFLTVWLASDSQPSTNVAHVLLGLWGLPMGMQSAAVRRLRVEGVFTTAATATIIVLVEHITTWSATVADRWAARGRARLFVRWRHRRRAALGTRAHLRPRPTIGDHRRGGRNCGNRTAGNRAAQSGMMSAPGSFATQLSYRLLAFSSSPPPTPEQEQTAPRRIPI